MRGGTYFDEGVQPPHGRVEEEVLADMRWSPHLELHHLSNRPPNLGNPPAQETRLRFQDTTAHAFNATAPNFLTSTILVTIASRNPNDKINATTTSSMSSLSTDQADGIVMLTIKIEGQVRFKVGIHISGRYHLYVKCPANIVFGNPTANIVVGNGIMYQLAQSQKRLPLII
ncbi:NDR1/HIN1-like protein 1 [Camellia lanceoleosa]|uniref:NDR1/HIN1-like protein 1 n=1 Tax=Camellia lanceoleosa TaxID=1840588 RepID=A0ACC0FA39_9ERIC|nr:NDR1/HIN1-like protein 1 [Camellia lanceoleosa]